VNRRAFPGRVDIEARRFGLKITARWFQVTGILIVLQFVLGGLAVSSNLTDLVYHIVLGFVIMAVATTIVAFGSKPSLRSLKIVSALLLVLTALQVSPSLGFLDSGSAYCPR
jgi:uncharacterized membrane protein YwaF